MRISWHHGAELRAPLKPLQRHSTMALRSLWVTPYWALIMPRAGSFDAKFSSIAERFLLPKSASLVVCIDTFSRIPIQYIKLTVSVNENGKLLGI